jgi:hypothetical protein
VPGLPQGVRVNSLPVQNFVRSVFA